MIRHKHTGLVFLAFTAVLFAILASGCQVLQVFMMTPQPLETPTPKLSLNQVTEFPTLPPITETPTPSDRNRTSYVPPADIFTQVKAEALPEKPYDPVVIFGTVSGFTAETDAWGNVLTTGTFEIDHHSGTEFRVTCDDFCFHVDARKNLLPSSSVQEGSEVIIFGSADEKLTDIRADLIAVHTLAGAPEVFFPDPAQFAYGLTYTEYELDDFPEMSPISIRAAAATSTPLPTATQPGSEATETAAAEYYNYYGYGYGYDPYFRPTSTPNRPPTETPTLTDSMTPEPEPTLDLDQHISDRLNHSLEGRTRYAYGAYGEKYSLYISYEQDQNRDPRFPTRAEITVESNGYEFTEYWIPYAQNPMFYTWGIVCYGGDWYMPLRLSVDINPEPGVVDVVYTDRTVRSQRLFDAERGYLRSFGYSIIDSKLFYFYQKENGFGVSINREDFDLGFDDIPFGYIGDFTEIDPFYSDDLITFFGHRGGKWYYVEIAKPAVNNGYYY